MTSLDSESSEPESELSELPLESSLELSLDAEVLSLDSVSVALSDWMSIPESLPSSLSPLTLTPSTLTLTPSVLHPDSEAIPSALTAPNNLRLLYDRTMSPP